MLNWISKHKKTSILIYILLIGLGIFLVTYSPKNTANTVTYTPFNTENILFYDLSIYVPYEEDITLTRTINLSKKEDNGVCIETGEILSLVEQAYINYYDQEDNMIQDKKENILSEPYASLKTSTQYIEITISAYSSNQENKVYKLLLLPENKNLIAFQTYTDPETNEYLVLADQEGLKIDAYDQFINSDILNGFYESTPPSDLTIQLLVNDTPLNTFSSVDYIWFDSILGLTHKALPQKMIDVNLETVDITLTDEDLSLSVPLRSLEELEDLNVTTGPAISIFVSNEDTVLTDIIETDMTNYLSEDGTNFILPLNVTSGPHKVEVTETWYDSPSKDYGSLTYSINLNVTLLESYKVLHSNYQPGDLAVIKGRNLTSVDEYTFETTIYNQGLKWNKVGDDYYLFLPIMSRQTPDSYSLDIYKNNELVDSLPINIIEKEFPSQQLTTSSATASLRNDAAYDEMYAAFDRGRASSESIPLWSGPFTQPVGGRISTEYGTLRYTNGSTEASVHGGIDFANPQGTEIMATSNGYVTLAESLEITGNTVFIDHGLGLYSQHYHMYEIYVNVGDYVEQGDIIGTVGTTGYSTGPHLHFGMYYNGIYLNPWKFFENDPLDVILENE